MSLRTGIAVDPASSTKHLARLSHPLPLPPSSRRSKNKGAAQSSETHYRYGNGSSEATYYECIRVSQSDAPGSTGTTLWLSAQVVSAYLATTLSLPLSAADEPHTARAGLPLLADADLGSSADPAGPGKALPSGAGYNTRRVLELGSGTGYLALCLAAWGYTVVATDIEPVLSSVLVPNVAAGLEALGVERERVQVRELDWLSVSEDTLGSLFGEASHCHSCDSCDSCDSCNACGPLKIAEDGEDGQHSAVQVGPTASSSHPRPRASASGFELIISTDTIYHPPLTVPLWTLLRRLSTHPSQRRPPAVYLGLERRDDRLVREALEVGRAMGFGMKAVSRGKLRKAFESVGWEWRAEDWDGVEVWLVRFEGARDRGKRGR